MDVFRLIDDLRENELKVNSVVITRYEDRPSTDLFITRLERRGIKVYKHYATKGYPSDVDTIVSDEGYGKNAYIETTKPIVVVTAPGPGSGKLATCLSQLYHEYKRGKDVGYSKFETFPVWNVPLKHPLNIAYEAATVDLNDVNMIDPFHLEEYGEIAVNYNRDIEAFPLLKRIIEKITGKKSIYQSPTDMGVNRVGFGITDDEVVRKASEQEIIRRYFKTGCDYKKGNTDLETFKRSEFIMHSLGLKEEDRKVVTFARKKLELLNNEEKSDKQKTLSAIAFEMPDGQIITGKKSSLMDAPSAAILNSLKYLSNFDDEEHNINNYKSSESNPEEAYLLKEEIEEYNSNLKLGEEPKKVPDIGFKVFKVDDTNIKWYDLENFNEESQYSFDDPDSLDFVLGSNDIDIVYEIMLRQNDVPLSENLEVLSDIGNRTYLYASTYLICLETEITEEMVEKLASLDPLPIKFVFRDSAFKDNISLKDETFRKLRSLIERNSGESKVSYRVEFI